jgi:ABC-2 type transport system permease protein
MRTALLIAGKDLSQRLRDRSALLIAFVVPFVLASIFGLTLHDVDTGQITFSYALVDLDRGAAARAFVRDVLGPVERGGFARVRVAPTLAAGRADAEDGRVAATFVIPAGFSSAVGTARPASIRVLGGVDDAIGTLVARSLAQSYAGGIDGVRLAVAAAAPTSAADATRLAARATASLTPSIPPA